MQACYNLETTQEEAARFETGCALLQTRQNGRIITGPIVLYGVDDGQTLFTFPENVDITLLDSAGNEIDAPTSGQPFFVSVPDTENSYKVTLAVATQTGGNALAAALSSLFAAARPRSADPMLPPGVALPDGYTLQAAITFRINPRSGCGCDCGCHKHCGCGGWQGGVGSAPAMPQPERNEFTGIGCCWYH